jgi:STAS domain
VADTPTRQAITDFVERVSTPGAGFVAAEDRIATFDNDGTLWCEKPMPIELGFILGRLADLAEQDESLRSRQPGKAAHTRDYRWLGDVITKHYSGDDSDVKVLMGGSLAAFAGMTVEYYEDAAEEFVREGAHPTLRRQYRDCAYRPMVELLRYLEANGFADADDVQAVVLDAVTIPVIDTTAAEMLRNLARELSSRGKTLFVVGDIDQVRDVIREAGTEAALANVYPTVNAGIGAAAVHDHPNDDDSRR